jgi:hypothetical protein
VTAPVNTKIATGEPNNLLNLWFTAFHCPERSSGGCSGRTTIHNLLIKKQMLKPCTITLLIKTWVLILSLPFLANAQLKIVSPVDRAIYQRDVTGQTTLSISGTYSQPLDRVEVRAVPVVPGQGIGTEWATLQNAPAGGTFLGTLRLQGGWYTLEVRGIQNGTVVGRDVVSRMGVGEVFIISGQSNAQGLRDYPGPGAQDDRVNYVVYDNTVNSLFDPPTPTFAQLSNRADIGPRGQTAWMWGILGDLLARKLNVPILFLNTAWEGTSIRNWAESAAGKSTTHTYAFYTFPPQMPYGNLLISTRYYASLLGARSILWMQGETETSLNTSTSDYVRDLQFLINALAGDTGKRFTWVISRTSRFFNTNPAVIQAQNFVINTPFNSTYPGPETDNLYLPRPDGVHFTGIEGLTQLANAWNNTLNTTFFSTINPVNPSIVPALSVACSADNRNINLTLPEGYSSYVWNSGQTGRSITVTSPGTYRATLKDDAGNAILSPAVTIENSVKPLTPSIVPGGQQQACADLGFEFSASGGTDQFVWSNNATGRTLRALQSGNYTVRARNVFGCISDASAPANLVVRPRVPQPVVEQSGPFSLTAELPETELLVNYEWKKNDQVLQPQSQVIKALEGGTYQARAKSVFTLASTGNTLTCYSPFSAPVSFTPSDGDAVVIFPNPARSGIIAIETRQDLTNAEVAFFNVDGRLIRSQNYPLLNERRTIPVGTLPPGTYIVRVRAAGVDVAKRIVVD